MKRYYGVDFDKQREALLNSETAKPLIDELIKKADAAVDTVYEVLKMSEFCMFEETGDRRIFEKKYFQRRNNCSYISIALWLTHDEKYIKPLIDHIFMICDEYTWCVPAHARMHIKPSAEDTVERVELFNSETARLMTDVLAAVGELLPYYVSDRIKYEIRRRIITPLTKCDFESIKTTEDNCFWVNSSDNWAGVCSGGVTVTLLHFGTTDEINKFLPIMQRTAERFLSGYKEDGCCVEGYAYWNYGFGYFLIFARAVYSYTNGKINYFENEKVKQIALYPQRMRMSKNKIASFADANSDFKFSVGCMSFLKSLYGDDFILPELSLGLSRGNIYSIKEFLWFDTEYKADEEKCETTFFDESQCFVWRGNNFSFAAKGGHNEEPHNHNDVGSFMIVTGDDIPFDDFGPAEYRKETFSDKRYTLLVNGSHGHSVPIINGEYQLYGREYCAKNVQADEKSFSLDIEGAYPDGIIDKIHRKFEMDDDGVTVNDIFVYSEKTQTVTERFVSKIKPELGDGYVDLKTAKVIYDSEKYNVSVHSEAYKSHFTLKDVTVYLVDFALQDKESEFKVKIVINR